MNSIIINAKRNAGVPENAADTLTVEELIKILKTFDKKAPVFIGDNLSGYMQIFGTVSKSDITESEPMPNPCEFRNKKLIGALDRRTIGKEIVCPDWTVPSVRIAPVRYIISGKDSAERGFIVHEMDTENGSTTVFPGKFYNDIYTPGNLVNYCDPSEEIDISDIAEIWLDINQ